MLKILPTVHCIPKSEAENPSQRGIRWSFGLTLMRWKLFVCLNRSTNDSLQPTPKIGTAGLGRYVSEIQ